MLKSKTLQWVADSVAPGAAAQSVSPLPGATSSSLFHLEVRHNGRCINLVLRQFTNKEWLAQEPDLVRHEAASLKKAGDADAPTPELIACDESGEQCGVPALLMTQLGGAVELRPQNLGRWLHQLAKAIIPLHAIQAETFPWRYQPYNDLAGLEPPDWSAGPDLWQRAIRIVNGPRPETRHSFIHRDYHPANVLWQDGQVSGIVDWVNACYGPINIDLAWCRVNLIHLYGVAAADLFLRAYQSLAGTFEHHPYWDLIVAIESLPGPPNVYPPWIAFDIRHLNSEMMQDRLDEYLVSVMARF